MHSRTEDTPGGQEPVMGLNAASVTEFGSRTSATPGSTGSWDGL